MEATQKPRRAAIAEGNHVVVRDMEGSLRVFQASSSANDLKMGKYHPIPMSTLFSTPYGATLRFEGGQWVRHCVSASGEGAAEEAVDEVAESNEHLAQDNSAQALTPADVQELKSRCTGEELVEALTNNSTTFAGKTKFSQEKYLRKKQQKYIQQVTLLRPTVMELCETYLKHSRNKMCGLRFDYLSAILCQADVRAAGRFFVLDCALGLVAAAVAQRLAGSGVVIRTFRGGCSDKGVQELDLGTARETLRQIPLDLLQSANPWSEEWLQDNKPPAAGEVVTPDVQAKLDGRQQRVRRRQADFRELEAGPMDSVVIVAGEEDTDVAEEALEAGLSRLAPGGRVVLFGQHLQPLASRQGAWKASGGYVDVRLVQLFTREYQVLPQRTHPIMTAEAQLCDGFLLTATKVLGDEPPAGAEAAQKGRGKRRRFR